MLFYSIAIVFLTVVFVFWIETFSNHWVKKLLNWFPAILFAYVVPAVFTHTFGLDLSGVGLHKLSKSMIMPMAIVLVMSALSFRQLRIIGVRPILVFVSGSFAVAVFPVIILGLAGLFTHTFGDIIIDQSYWKGLVPIVGSWIGGSTSMLVLKEVVDCPEAIFLSVLIMDNVLVNIWTIFMFQSIKQSDRVNKSLGIKDKVPDFIPDKIEITQNQKWNFAFTLILCIISVLLAAIFVKSFIFQILILSVAGLMFGNLLKFWNHAFVIKAGGVFIVLIMAILGLKLNFENFSIPIPIVIFAIIWLISHFVVMIISAFYLKLHMAWVPISSMANVGGISTAPAVTKAYNEEWMPHAILLAILSMVSGTTWGLLTIWLFKMFFGV